MKTGKPEASLKLDNGDTADPVSHSCHLPSATCHSLFIADTHVHFYPGYDLKVAFKSFLDSTNKLAPGAVKAMFLAERHDCCFFADLKSERIAAPDGFRVEATGDDNVLVIRSDSDFFYMFAGRQIVTSERIEILSLGSDQPIDDGQRAIEVVYQVKSGGGIPVLAWALGKWMFQRKRVIKNLLASFCPEELVLGDSIMRPQFWQEPGLMKFAAEKGFAVLAGTDPLPFANEERFIGTYASVMDGIFDASCPLDSARKLLFDPHSRRVGKRCNPAVLLMRQMKL